MDADAEIAALKERVAKLERVLTLYAGCLQLQPPDPKTGSGAGLHIWCTSIGLVDSTAPDKTQAYFASTPTGAHLSFCDKQGTAMMCLHNPDGLPRIELGPADEPGLDLALDEDGVASMTLSFKDQPRVVLSAEEHHGRVMTAFDDEQGRAILVGTAEGGQLVLTNSDLNPSIVLRGDGPGGGGITVGGGAGKPALIMGSMSGMGVVTVLTSDGKILSRLPTDSDLASGGIDPDGE